MTARRTEALDDAATAGATAHPASRRHRTTSDALAPPRVPGELTDALRSSLWNVIHGFLFAPQEGFDPWTNGVTGRPAVLRVWTARPIGGEPALIPDDVADLLDGWFSLIEPIDVFALLESVATNLEPSKQDLFAAACNGALERGFSDQRFVHKRLVPVASRSDVATIERALCMCKALGSVTGEVEERLLDAIDRLATKPEPDGRGAIQEAIRAVECAAFILTGERHLTLDDTLVELEARGYLEGALKVAYGGLFEYAAGHRVTTSDDARLVLVMCAGFVTHLASKMR
jgi:hypothetical protein